ncbi:hypothetical protein M3Y94_00981900 [Aphelenchoides besseyi]|nr:hypothetical protein M3Y94_00981900 [Aphelenchoides besseyi]KAI6221069.1 hypothetical protein M3Y95_01001800 [Aphelenchoides besseyi]
MSRPSIWTQVWSNFWASWSRQAMPNKRYVGQDHLGNRFYEFAGRHQSSNVKRGYEPGPQNYEPSVEWTSWLSGARRFPPSEQEIAINQAREEHQLKIDSQTERRAPQVTSEGKGAADVDQPKHYPSYDDAEIAPGARKQPK